MMPRLIQLLRLFFVYTLIYVKILSHLMDVFTPSGSQVFQLDWILL